MLRSRVRAPWRLGAQPRSSGAAAAILLVVVLGGILVTVALADRESHAPGTFWSQTQVRFVAPAIGKSTANDVLSPSVGVVMTAQAVANIVDPSRAARVSSTSATLAGQGVRHGFSVVLPNTGGQWANQFISPYLDVQVVGSTANEVTERTKTIITRIETTLAVLQARANVPVKWRIREQLSPPGNPPLYYERGSAIRAGAATLLLGLSLTLGVAGMARRMVSPLRLPARGAVAAAAVA